jgi:two-component system response regulator FixJ
MTVALIEDDEAVLHSLQLLLRNKGIEAEGFNSVESFFALADLRRFDSIVSDVRLPGKSGLELQDELAARGVNTPLILVTGHGDIAMAVRAIKRGAFDFVEKPYNDERLLASVVAAREAGHRKELEERERSELSARFSELSPRQREVIALVADGLANKEVAQRLDISPRTVENYRAWAMEKLGATGLADLVRKIVLLSGAK